MERYLKKQILSDLGRKMVFLAGPRQVGKTTLSKQLLKSFDYLNWDIDQDRNRILKKEIKNKSLWVFDEIHKYATWRNYLKGLYDQYGKEQKILVTGSAKLNILRKGGDSLQGRYHFLRLHPLSFSELKSNSQKDLQTLFNLSGFPEPFFSSSKKECDRWSNEYGSLLVKYEISSLEQIQDLGNLELIYSRLPVLVGSPLSVNSLREDLQLAHKTVEKWIEAFERSYGLFRISTFGGPKVKALKKMQKHYFYDWNLVKAQGPRFENLIACALLKWVEWSNDTEGKGLELRYYRDNEEREVDFIISEQSQPVFAIEVKLSDEAISKHLVYFKSKFPEAKCFQISLNGEKEFLKEGIHVMPAYKFLKDLI